jgi:hypothetical protein
LRQEFQGLEKEKVETLKRLNTFFEEFKNISVKDFLSAPYIVFKDEQYFDLKFYLTRRAIKAYDLYLKQLLSSEPDSDMMLEKAEESFKFVEQFISEKGINIDDYAHHCEGLSHSILLHLKDGKIPIYFIFCLKDGEKVVKSMSEDLIGLWFDDNFFEVLSKAQFKFNKSIKLKSLIINKINNINKIN